MNMNYPKDPPEGWEEDRNRILKEWNDLHQKRVLQELKDKEKDWSKEVTKELDRIYKKREGWYD